MKIEINSKEYQLSPVGMRVISAAQEHIKDILKQESNDALNAVAATGNMVAVEAAVNQFFYHQRRFVGMDEIGEYFQSPGGTQFLFWQSLTKYHADLPFTEAQELFDSMSGKQLAEVTSFISENTTLLKGAD